MPKKSYIEVTLPDGTTKTLEGVSELSNVPQSFWIEVADALGLQGIREKVICEWDFVFAQDGDHDLQFIYKHKVTVFRGVQSVPNCVDYTSGATVDVVRFVDWSN